MKMNRLKRFFVVIIFVVLSISRRKSMVYLLIGLMVIVLKLKNVMKKLIIVIMNMKSVVKWLM